jgi:hypothetical protein
MGAPPASSEHQVRHARFQVPVDDRNCSQVEGGMRDHQHEDAAGECEDCSEYQACDHRLFDAGDSLNEVVERPEQYGGD